MDVTENAQSPLAGCTASWLICGESMVCERQAGHGGAHRATVEWNPMADEPARPSPSGKPRASCPVCEREVIVTVTGHLMRHDVPRGTRKGPLPRCQGSGEFVGIPDPGWPPTSLERPR